MKQRNSFSLTLLIAILTTATIMLSCNKKFDEPPYDGPGLTPTTTIAGLKARHTALSSINPINDTASVIIGGVVVANDQSGNLYKAIYIVDATGGLEISLGGSYLYNAYPVGMKVYIKCNGLALSDYGGDMELGMVTTAGGSSALIGIPSTLMPQYLYPGTLHNDVPVKVVTLATLKSMATLSSTNPAADTLQNTLVQINNVQFSDISGSLYSDTSAAKQNISRTMVDCSAGTTVAYTSGYADFAGVPLPKGGGTITAVYVPYRAASELLIRDTSDVKLTGLRCDGTTGQPGPVISIDSLRRLYTGTTITALAPYTVHGVVISDIANKNIAAGNVVIQDGNKGISVYFGSAVITYNIGDSIVINASGAKLQNYNGSLELDPVGTPPAPVATGKVITPLSIGSAGLIASLTGPISTSIENTLVKIVDATTPTGTYSGTKTLTDSTGSSLSLFTLATATFSGTAMPGTTKTNFVGYASQYTTTSELKLRNIGDVNNGVGSGGAGPAPTTTQSIAQIRAMTPGVLGAYTIHGTVISNSKNISAGAVVIQDGNAGIELYYSGTTITYNVGDSIVVNVTGATLEAYKGALEITAFSGAAATPPAAVATNVTVMPRTATIAQINASIGTYEYTLVTIVGATATGGTTYSGSKTLNDGASITMYTSTAAAFATTTLPTGTHSWTGFPYSYSPGAEFSIRSTADVQ